jgi:hypothetical protein
MKALLLPEVPEDYPLPPSSSFASFASLRFNSNSLGGKGVTNHRDTENAERREKKREKRVDEYI